jgi:hypothetical protein
MGLQAFLGGDILYVENVRLGQTATDLESTFGVIQTNIPTGSVQMYFDSADWNGISSTLLGRYANATASLTNVTVGVSSSLNFTTSSNLSTTASADETPSQASTSTIVLIYRSSGSATDYHGRFLNGANNWLFGTYGGSIGTPAAESMYSWFNNQFVIDSGSYDTNWHMMTGIRHNVNSASVYIDNLYKTGSLQSNAGFDAGLFVNKGAFTPNEATQGELGVLAVYNRELTPNEINEIYLTYFTKYGL